MNTCFSNPMKSTYITLLAISSIVILVSSGSLASAAPKDAKPPTVKIISPIYGATITAGNTMITGSASDTGTGMKNVQVRIDVGSFKTAVPVKSGDWSRWSASMSMLVLGTHKIEVKATDVAGNYKLTSISVSVVDKTPPQITPPSKITTEATGPMSNVNIGTPIVKDDVDPSPSVTNNAPQTFPVGVTNIMWTAKDSSGNIATSAQTIEVRDTTPPVLSIPNNIVTSDIHVTYSVSATDLVDGVVTVACSPNSGSSFPISVITNVSCTATDSHNNIGYGGFDINVIEEGAWFYQSKFADPLDETMVDQLIERHVNTIYFSNVNENFKSFADYDDSMSFINHAKSNGMRVFAVTMQDPVWVMKSESELTQKFSSTIAATSDIFDTYIIDVEPHSLCKIYPNYPCFNQDSQTEADYLQRYITMSQILRNVADGYNVKFVDTVPSWYHSHMKDLGVSSLGIGSLSSNSINVMDYASTQQQVMDRISGIRAEVTTPIVVNIKITTSDAPWLEGAELTSTIAYLKQQQMAVGIFESSYLFQISASTLP